MDRKYYKRINNLDIALEETNHKYIMIHQWAVDNSHKWGIASFRYTRRLCINIRIQLLQTKIKQQNKNNINKRKLYG